MIASIMFITPKGKSSQYIQEIIAVPDVGEQVKLDGGVIPGAGGGHYVVAERRWAFTREFDRVATHLTLDLAYRETAYDVAGTKK
jgi:hypothetical protein